MERLLPKEGFSEGRNDSRQRRRGGAGGQASAALQLVAGAVSLPSAG